VAIATLDSPGTNVSGYVANRFGIRTLPSTAQAPTTAAGGAPVSNATAPGTAQDASATIQPEYLSQLFPNGIPQTTTYQSGTPQQVQSPSQVAAILQASQSLPQVGTSNVGTSNVGTNSILGTVGNQIGAGALQNEVTAAMQPQFTANQHALDEELANAGISGGSSLGAQVDLGNTEDTQLAGALAPYEQTAQQQTLAAATSDAGNQLTASGQNASNRLGASTTNAANQLTASGQNAGNALTVGNDQVNNILQASTANQTADQNNSQYNATAANAQGQYNTSNLLQAGTFDANAYNTGNQQAANINNQDYLQQLLGQQQLASGGQAGQTSAYTSTFQNPSAGTLSGFAPTISAAQPTTPAPTAQPTVTNPALQYA
jgi:hypothetical protein